MDEKNSRITMRGTKAFRKCWIIHHFHFCHYPFSSSSACSSTATKSRFIEWHQPLIGPSVLYWNIHSLLILFSLLSFNRDYFTIDCKQIYCDFNNLCLCQNYSQHYFDITCVNVPMDSFPNLTELSIRDQRYRHLYRVRIIGSKHLTRIEAGHFDNIMTLASLSITKTRLIHIDPQTFIMTPISSTLTSLDLSYGNLYEIPFEAIEPLNELRWLSLKGNQIESIQNSMIHSNKLQNDRNHHRSSQGIMTNRSISNNIGLKSLKTLLLNENQLVLIEDRSFRNFPSLELINFDHNMIERIEGDPFPSNLKSLYLSNCLLRKIPFESIQNLPLLELLQLKGNLINHLSPFKLSVRRIQLIDLSHNLITRIPEDLFANFNGQPTSFNFDTINTNTINRSRNGTKNNAREDGEQQNNSNSMDSTIYNFDFHYENGMNESATNHRSSIDWRLPSSSLRIDQLYLDFNFIQSLPNGVFRGVLIHKLSISNNRLTSSQIDPETFQGPTEFGLKVLDFNYNLIDGYPIALKSLRSLQRLSLRNNRIDRIDSDAFERCTSTLENLDLSQNLFEEIPSKALNRLKNLIKLNMHDNVIQSVNKNSLEGWCRKLKSLTLSKNGLVHLDPDAFHQCNQLSELRLGGNKFLHLQANLFDANNLSKLQLLDLSSLRKVDWIEQSGNNRHHANHFDEENKYNSNGNKRSKNQLNLIANNQSEESLYEKNILSQLKWLQFDFNRIEKIPPEMIRLFPRIKHLDLQNNLIKTIENDDFKGLNNLTSIILSNNNIRVLRTSSFENLKQLESLTLHFNRIKTIQTHSFNRLPRLQSLVLSKNQINYLWPDSFYNLSTQSRSLTLMLDDNRIQCFSVDCLRNIFLRNNLEKAHPQQNRSTQFVQDFSLYLNISHNRIKTFENCSNYWTFSQRRNRKNFEHTFNQHHHHHRHQQSSRSRIEISVLDLSHNQIENFQREFFDEFCSNTLSLLINNNLIRSLPLKLFIQCKRLQTLSLNYNLIQNVRNDLDFISDETNTNDDDMIGLNKSNSNDRDRIIKHFSIQSLSLHHNSIANLQGFAEIFDRSLRLKILNLDHNKIESLPFDIFHRTSLISLSISSNLLESLDSSGDLNDKCFGISGSLKYLDLSKNLLSSLPKRILHCQNLIELILSENRIYLIDTILMRPLSRLLINLQRLELNQNPIDFNHFDRKIRADFDFLNNNSMLLVLNLNHLNLVRLQELNLPYLHTLDLSWNNLNSIHNRIFSQTRNIRSLNLASNRLNEIPKNIWKYITRLQHLNLCDNPIDVLDSSSFAGLKFLRFLDIRGLNLQFIDSRIFIYQSQISTLKISTYPQIRSYRLQDILAKTDSLKTIVVDVQESILSHQIQWAFGGKLRELVITGQHLNIIVPDAFQGLNNANDLTLRITNTSIKNLPDGLLQFLADIRYITIDLRHNSLSTISPTVFFDLNQYDQRQQSIKTWQSRQLLGGIILDNNPLICDCNLLWFSRWMREIFTEMKSINVEAAIHAKSTLSLSKCNRSCTDESKKTKKSNDDFDEDNYDYYYDDSDEDDQNQNSNSHLDHNNRTISLISIIDLRKEDLCHSCAINSWNSIASSSKTSSSESLLIWKTSETLVKSFCKCCESSAKFSSEQMRFF